MASGLDRDYALSLSLCCAVYLDADRSSTGGLIAMIESWPRFAVAAEMKVLHGLHTYGGVAKRKISLPGPRLLVEATHPNY